MNPKQCESQRKQLLRIIFFCANDPLDGRTFATSDPTATVARENNWCHAHLVFFVHPIRLLSEV